MIISNSIEPQLKDPIDWTWQLLKLSNEFILNWNSNRKIFYPNNNFVQNGTCITKYGWWNSKVKSNAVLKIFRFIYKKKVVQANQRSTIIETPWLFPVQLSPNWMIQLIELDSYSSFQTQKNQLENIVGDWR